MYTATEEVPKYLCEVPRVLVTCAATTYVVIKPMPTRASVDSASIQNEANEASTSRKPGRYT